MDKINYYDVLDYKGSMNNFITNEPYSDNYIKLGLKWSTLPLYTDINKIKQFFELLNTKQVILVISGTGSGKTVFIPKYFLKYLITMNMSGKIAITNPKQITTYNNAVYGAMTLDIKLGNEVGYAYKDAPKNSHDNNTRLLYATDGLIISIMNTKDRLLSEYAGIIIDEAHERNVQIDFLLKYLKDILIERTDFKIIIMSATINPEVFNKYYNIEGINYGEIEILTKPNFPIEQIWNDKEINIDKYLKYIKSKYNNVQEYITLAINKVIDIINKKDSNSKNDILIFVPTVSDTNIGCKLLELKTTNKPVCIELHSKTDEADKDQATQINNDHTKIIFSTNVAESSLTFDGLLYVIDTGLELSNTFDSVHNMFVVKKIMTSQSQIIQRIGRTGRTMPGIAYHLYTQAQFNKLKKYPDPEILITDLTDKILILFQNKNIEEVQLFLNNLITKPHQEQIDNSIYKLLFYNLISFSNNGYITKIGKRVSLIKSIDFILAYGILISKFLNCQSEIIIIAAIIDTVENLDKLFKYPIIKLKEFKNYIFPYSYINSDHITILNIYNKLYKNNMTKYLDIEIFNKINKTIKKINNMVNDIIIDDALNEKFKLISIIPFDNIEDNILFILYKMYKLNLIFQNETKNFMNNVKGTLEFSSATKIDNINADKSYYICHNVVNRFNKQLFVCCTEIPERIIIAD
uniref:Helicase ATP-binding domain-containing protein n=1 Tax=viral metagenome TaxID=1070528 RepID=A0A6C0H7W0_9ZZZZ